MNRVLNGSSIYVDDKSLNGSDAWKYIYDQLTQCGDYRDAQTMLDAFVIVNSKESGTTITTVDNLGNENTRNRNQYYYDSQGRLIRGSGTLLEMMLFGRYYTSGSTFYFDYAESGQISKISYGSSSGYGAFFVPTYDENGNIISMEVTTNSGTYTHYYTYDENGRPLTAEFSTVKETKCCNIRFTYDDAGRLVKLDGKIKYTSYEQNCPFETTYTYNENGHLVEQSIQIFRSKASSWQNDWFVSYDITCDDNGNPASAVVTGSDYSNYASVVAVFHIKDLYFYEP